MVLKNSTVSIVVPVYNVEKYIDKCVCSLISQTYKDIEIILVNDGSTDNSGLICDKYKNMDTRVRVIHKKNGGLSDARNAGIDISSGEYIAFVDSDDYVSKNFISTLYQLSEETNSDIAECGHTKFYDNDEVVTELKSADRIILSPQNWLTETKMRGFLSVVVWNKLYRKSVFDEIRFPVGRVYEDDSTTYKLVYKSNQVARTYSPLYYYRCRKDSIMNSGLTKKKLQDNRIALKEQIDFFEKHNEKEIKDFCCARYSIYLVSVLSQNHSFEIDASLKESIQHDIKESFMECYRSRGVPLKYKIYILLYYMGLIRRR